LAARLAGALGFIALPQRRSGRSGHAARGCIGERAPTAVDRLAMGLWRFLERLSPTGTTNLDASSRPTRDLRGSGLALVVSDLFSPAGYQNGIDALLARRQDVLLVQCWRPMSSSPRLT